MYVWVGVCVHAYVLFTHVRIRLSIASYLLWGKAIYMPLLRFPRAATPYPTFVLTTMTNGVLYVSPLDDWTGEVTPLS